MLKKTNNTKETSLELTKEDLKNISYSGLKRVYKKKGYKFFESGAYDLNVCGFRIKTGTNDFDDLIAVAYLNENLKGVVETYDATTDPGETALRKLIVSRGTAILAPGQYRGVYKLDKHNGRYTTLCQRGGKVKVYRDANRNSKHDFEETTTEEGMFGINIHRANSRYKSRLVDTWSYGCQVIADPHDHARFVELVKIQNKIYESVYTTYTLFDVRVKK